MPAPGLLLLPLRVVASMIGSWARAKCEPEPRSRKILRDSSSVRSLTLLFVALFVPLLSCSCCSRTRCVRNSTSISSRMHGTLLNAQSEKDLCIGAHAVQGGSRAEARKYQLIFRSDRGAPDKRSSLPPYVLWSRAPHRRLPWILERATRRPAGSASAWRHVRLAPPLIVRGNNGGQPAHETEREADKQTKKGHRLRAVRSTE